MGLTDAQIKALQPRAARYLVSDGRGLSLDVLPSGVKSWMYGYRIDGKPQKVTLGRYPDLTFGGNQKGNHPVQRRSDH